MFNWNAATYVAYLLVTVPLTIWVARTLSKNGKVFLADVFEGKDGLADAVNQLLVVGFYLLNLGFVLLYLRNGREVFDLTGMLEALSVKVGFVMLVLGVIHFMNVYVFNTIRRRSRMEALRTAPVAPQGTMPPPQPPYVHGGPRPYPAPGR
jgi:hypothetical protein